MRFIQRALMLGGIAVSTVSLLGTSVATASGVKVIPGTFVGSSADCGGAPAGTKKGVSAAWVTGIGLPDGGTSNHALVLTKSDPTEACSAAGASVDGVAGLTADTLGFDHLVASSCDNGAPRFNVQATDGFHFVGGCGNPSASRTPVAGNADWEHIVFDLHSDTQAFPAVAPGATLISVSLIQDEQGSTTLDNINVDNQFIVGKPGNA